MEKKQYTIIAFSENHIGLLNRITIIFTRRHINIESLTVSPSEVKGIHRFTIVINSDADQVEKVVRQIEKQVEVLRAFYYLDDEVIHQEIALYKIRLESFAKLQGVEELIRNTNARILTIEPEYIVMMRKKLSSS